MIFDKCWCGSSEYKTFAQFRTKFRDSGSPRIKIVKCKSCGTVRMYDNTLDVIPDYIESYEYRKLSGRHLRSINIIKQFAKPGSILDVGCNTGMLLNGIKENVKELKVFKGIDLDSNAIKLGIERTGLDLETKNLYDLEGMFDNIVLCHTFEHIPELEKFLAELDNRLNPGGKIFISVPNINSFNARAALRIWKALAWQFHLWYFDQNSIARCFKQSLPGYKLIHSSSFFTWPPLYYSAPVWKYLTKNNQKFVGKLESRFLGDQLDVVIEKNTN